jgi:hypothetical protein
VQVAAAGAYADAVLCSNGSNNGCHFVQPQQWQMAVLYASFGSCAT